MTQYEIIADDMWQMEEYIARRLQELFNDVGDVTAKREARQHILRFVDQMADQVREVQS